jgi:hypothetical protein
VNATLLASTRADDVVAIVVSVFAALVIVVLGYVMAALVRTLRELRTSMEELRAETLPLVADLRSTVVRATDDLERVDGLIVRAESISATVDSASRLAYLAFSNPVIKALAFGTGTARAVRRFRRNREE